MAQANGMLHSLELAVGWFGDYDSYDLASLTMLAHGPTVYLHVLMVVECALTGYSFIS